MALLVGAAAVQLLVILILIKGARDRRANCNWDLHRANRNALLATLGIIASQILPLLGGAQPGSPMMLACLFLLYVSVYKLARALYRRRDVRLAVAQ